MSWLPTEIYCCFISEDIPWETVAGGRISRNIRKQSVRVWTHAVGLRYGPMVGFCGHGTDSSCYTRRRQRIPRPAQQLLAFQGKYCTMKFYNHLK